MLNQNAIALFERKNSERDSFFAEHSDLLSRNINTFRELKTALYAFAVTENDSFQRRYCSFFGMRHINRNVRHHYFDYLERHKRDTLFPSAHTVTEDLFPLLGKRYFSFATKMLCIVNDVENPIFDKNVEKVFRVENHLCGEAYREALYVDIKDTYLSLINHPIVADFRERFNAEDIGVMKILDAIFWVIGREL